MKQEELRKIIGEAEMEAREELKFAEQYINGEDLSTVLFKCRYIGEIITKAICEAVGIPNDSDQNERLKQLKEIKFERGYINLLDFIRSKGNKGVHGGSKQFAKMSLDQARIVIENAFEVTSDFIARNEMIKEKKEIELPESVIKDQKELDELLTRANRVNSDHYAKEQEISLLKKKYTHFEPKKIEVYFDDLVAPAMGIAFIIYFIAIFLFLSSLAFDSFKEGFNYFTQHFGLFVGVLVIAGILAGILIAATGAFVPVLIAALIKGMLAIINGFISMFSSNKKQEAYHTFKEAEIQFEEKRKSDIESFNASEIVPLELVNSDSVNWMKKQLETGKTIKEAAEILITENEAKALTS